MHQRNVFSIRIFVRWKSELYFTDVECDMQCEFSNATPLSYLIFLTFLVKGKLDGFTIPMCKQMEVPYIYITFLLLFLSCDVSEYQK